MFFLNVIIICNYVCLPSAKGRTIRKVMGGRKGGGRAKYKKNSCNGKLSEKIHTQRVAQKKSSCIRKKNIPTREMLTKKFAQLENPPPPNLNNFSNGPSLSIDLTLCVLPKNVWERPC